MKKTALLLALMIILQALCACQVTTPQADGTTAAGTEETTLSPEQQEEIYQLLRKVAGDWSTYITIVSNMYEAFTITRS